MTWAHVHLDVSLTSLLSLGNPVISTIGAWAIFSQALSASQVAGAIVVLIALGVIVSKQRSDRGARGRSCRDPGSPGWVARLDGGSRAAGTLARWPVG